MLSRFMWKRGELDGVVGVDAEVLDQFVGPDPAAAEPAALGDAKCVLLARMGGPHSDDLKFLVKQKVDCLGRLQRLVRRPVQHNEAAWVDRRVERRPPLLFGRRQNFVAFRGIFGY
ncbi:hypothetical protein BH24ACI3_BH24ACI3_15340 [soil metagenome]